MLDAVIFDKDGTLFDFKASWGVWTERLLAVLTADAAEASRLTAILGYSLKTRSFAKSSAVISATTPEIAELLQPHLRAITFSELNAMMNQLSADAPMQPAVALRPVLGALKARGLKLGLATNDTEYPARRHLERAGVLDLFDFVVGCDSGFGGKPAPGQLLEFVVRFDLSPARVAMVGDSLHDLDAGRAAGMYAVAVLTGIATAQELGPHADIVLPDISHLGGWIDGLAATCPVPA